MSLTIQEQIDKLRNDSAVIAITQELSAAIKENDLNALDQMMQPNYLTILTSEKKIEIIFEQLNSALAFNNTGEDLMKFLIFDFQITERFTIISDNDEIPVDDRVKKMFQTRRLSKELETDLQVHENKSQKQIKL